MNSFHSLQTFNKIVNSTWGLDKTVRLVQYVSRILKWWYLRQGNHTLSDKWTSLGAQIANYRIITRMTGVPATIQELLSPVDEVNQFEYVSRRLQSVSMLFFYSLENVAWLFDREILGKRDTTNMWLYSCRAWLLWVVVNITLNVRSFMELQRKLAAAKSKRGEGTNAEEIKLLHQKRLKLCLQLVVDVSDFTLALQWSLKNQPFSDVVIGVSGTIGTAIGYYSKWKTASS